MRLSSTLCLISAVLLAAAPASASSFLVGTSTLKTLDDLTVIQTEKGKIFEWLDLSTTDGMSIRDALATYSADGFRWGSGSEVATLFSAFGIDYASAPNTDTYLGASYKSQQTFVEYLGYTSSGDPRLPEFAALGWIDDLTSGGSNTYSCLSWTSGACYAISGFVANGAFASPGSQVGVYLVRDQPVPEPGSLLLLGSGLVALLARRSTRTQGRQENRL